MIYFAGPPISRLSRRLSSRTRPRSLPPLVPRLHVAESRPRSRQPSIRHSAPSRRCQPPCRPSSSTQQPSAPGGPQPASCRPSCCKGPNEWWRPPSPPPPPPQGTRHGTRPGKAYTPIQATPPPASHGQGTIRTLRHVPTQTPPYLKGRGAAGQVEYGGPLACAATGGWGGVGWGGLDSSGGGVCLATCEEARLTTCGGGVKRCGPSKVW